MEPISETSAASGARGLAATDTSAVFHDLAHYTRPVRRHLWFVAFCLLVGIVVGVGVSTLLRTTYTSSARVLVLTDITDQGVGNAAGSRTSGTVNLDTEAQVLRSEPVAALAKTTFPTSLSPTELLKHVTVTVPANTSILTITYKAGSAGKAEAGATAFAKAYLDNRTTVAQNYVKAQVASVNKQISSANAQLKKMATAAIDEPVGSAARNFDDDQVTTLQSQITSLNGQLTSLTTVVLNPGRVISPATVATRGGLARDIVIASFAVLGLLVGLVGAFARDHRGARVRYDEDLAALGVPTLGTAPTRRESRRGRRAAVAESQRVETCDYRTATELASRLGSGVVLIASTSEAQWTRTQALAERLAGQLEGLGHSAGVISSAELKRATLRAPKVPATEAIQTAVRNARSEADYLLVVAPAGAKSELFVLAGVSDILLLVVTAGTTTQPEVADILREARLSKLEVLGAVFDSRKPAPKALMELGHPRSVQLSSPAPLMDDDLTAAPDARASQLQPARSRAGLRPAADPGADPADAAR
jgi:capsular polysaccharide biosynthesis protein